MHYLVDKSGFQGEVFPKQDHIVPGRFGSQVKMPCGIHKKNGARSRLAIGSSITQLINLDNNIPDSVKFSKTINNPSVKSDGLFYCQRKMVQDGLQLTGGDGHHARLALAANALKANYSVDEIVDMYKCQSDFNESYTRDSILYIKNKGYYCSCAWLFQNSRTIVEKYCKECKTL
jgi:hypothetical protein